VNKLTGDETRAHLSEYVKEFLKGYRYAIDTNFLETHTFITEAGHNRKYFPFYGRELGVNLAIAAFVQDRDLLLFFLEETDVKIHAYADADQSVFGREWRYNTPITRRIQVAIECLGLEGGKIIRLGDPGQAITVIESDLIDSRLMSRDEHGYRLGIAFGNAAGLQAETALPRLRRTLQDEAEQRAISERYVRLVDAEISPQARGIEFEKLWRDVLDFYGWRPKKIRIPGEDNDFTAIYQGLHVLGEVRWFDKPMNGGKMREFLAKLDPRPQTIGLFVSYSGVDPGGISVVRRAVNTKTVVIFGKAEIEKIILDFANPGPIFDEKLRDAYDYIFESTEGN
jgi:hypothetical protein